MVAVLSAKKPREIRFGSWAAKTGIPPIRKKSERRGSGNSRPLPLHVWLFFTLPKMSSRKSFRRAYKRRKARDVVFQGRWRRPWEQAEGWVRALRVPGGAERGGHRRFQAQHMDPRVHERSFRPAPLLPVSPLWRSSPATLAQSGAQGPRAQPWDWGEPGPPTRNPNT